MSKLDLIYEVHALYWKLVLLRWTTNKIRLFHDKMYLYVHWLLCYTYYTKHFKVRIRECESWETEHWYREWGAEGNLTMNSPWKNLQSVNQPTHRLQRASAGNTESLMLSVLLQLCNEISGQSDWIILMVFSRFVPRALTPLTDKAWLWKKISLSDGHTNKIWGWSIYTGSWGSSQNGQTSGVSHIRINLAMCSFQSLLSIHYIS